VRSLPASVRSVSPVIVCALLVACGGFGGAPESAVFGEVGESLPAASSNVEVDCAEESRDDCEQAVSAIVNGLPAGDEVTEIELRALDKPLAMTPAPPWSASATVTMENGFVYELVIIQEMRPGPMHIDFAPDR
jgi:hypothetical protein